MNPFKLVMKFLKALRGGASGKQIFLGAFLGFAVGLVPGVNLTLLLFLLPLLFLNINGGAAAIFLVIGKVLMFVAAAVLYYAGFVLIQYLGFSKGVAALADTPVLALLNWHVYAVFGAFVLAFLVGCPLAGMFSRAMFKMQAALSAAGQAESKTKVGGFGRALLKFLAGKPGDQDAPAPSLLRKGRCIVALVIMAIGLFGYFFMLDGALASVMRNVIGKINGAQVDISSVDLSLGAGRLVISGLEVTDADKPARNRVAAGEIVMNISVADLLRKRMVVDDISASDVRLSSKRAAPGKVFTDSAASVDTAGKDEDKSDTLLNIAGDAVGDSAAKAIEYAKQVKDVGKKLADLKDYLQERSRRRSQQRQEDIDQRRRDELRARGFLKAAAVELLPQKPLWHIIHAKADSIVLKPHLPGFTIVAENIASDQDLVEGSMSIIARPDDEALKSLSNATDEVKNIANNFTDAVKDSLNSGGDVGKDTEKAAKKAAKNAEKALKNLFGK